MKKGFTLIELIAVIVLLGIISLLAIPEIMKTINNVKKDAALKGAEAYIRVVNQTAASYANKSNNLEGAYKVEDLITGYNMNYDGKMPTNDSKIYIFDNEVKYYVLKVDGFTIVNKYIIDNKYEEMANYYFTLLENNTSYNDYQQVTGKSYSYIVNYINNKPIYYSLNSNDGFIISNSYIGDYNNSKCYVASSLALAKYTRENTKINGIHQATGTFMGLTMQYGSNFLVADNKIVSYNFKLGECTINSGVKK